MFPSLWFLSCTVVTIFVTRFFWKNHEVSDAHGVSEHSHLMAEVRVPPRVVPEVKEMEKRVFPLDHLQIKRENGQSPKTTSACETDKNWMSCRFKHLSYDVESKSFFVNCCGHNCANPEFSDLKLLGRDIATMRPYIEVKCSRSPYVSVNFRNRKVILATHRYSPHNAGHLMMETALPLEMLAMKHFFVRSSERVLLLNDDCFDGLKNADNTIHWFESSDESTREWCDTNSYSILSPIANGAIHSYHDIVNRYKNMFGVHTGVITFDQDVLIGIGGISPWIRSWNEISFNPVIDNYVHHARKFNRVRASRSHLQASPKETLTFLHKTGRRSVLNWQQLDTHLAVLAHSRDMHYLSLDLANVSFRDQLSALEATTTLVTVGGSTAFATFFMNRSPFSRVIYFPLLQNDFEVNLLSSFPTRWNLIRYAQFDGNWVNDTYGPVINDDGSFIVDIDVVKYLVDSKSSKVTYANDYCPTLNVAPFVDVYSSRVDALVKKVPIDLNIGVPYFVGAEKMYEHVAGWVNSDYVNYVLCSSWLKNRTHKVGIALDLGANRGFYTYFFAALNLTVYSWEIEGQMFKELQHGMVFNGLGKDRVHLNLIGLSNNNTYMKESGSGGSGYLAPSSQEEATILTMTLDCWANLTQFSHKTIDIVKIDIEGFEIAALLGAHDTLFDPSVRIGALLIEVGPDRWPRSNIQFGAGVSVLMELSKKFLKSSLILRNDGSCPQTIKNGLFLHEFTWEGVLLHEITEKEWFPLMKKMNLGGFDCNFFFFN